MVMMQYRNLLWIRVGMSLVLFVVASLWITSIYRAQRSSLLSTITLRDPDAISLPLIATAKKLVVNTAQDIPKFQGAAARYHTNFAAYPDLIAQQYTIHPKPCKDLPSKTFLVLIVFSRTTGFALRQAIRKTWGSLASPVCGVRLLFMFGRVYDPELQQRLQTEAYEHGDMIQSNQFDDVYRGAAEKALHLLQWGATFCPESVYTAKIDDDNWLNLPLYYKFLQENQKNDHVYGAMFGTGSPVIRATGTKYFVPREEYEPDKYPEYLSGVLYAFPTRFIPRVLLASKEVRRTFNDDVYVCGLLATKANLTRRPVPRYAWDQVSAQKDSKCVKKDMMSVHYSKIEDFYRMWEDPCYRYEELC